jgi:hypothetical protein
MACATVPKKVHAVQCTPSESAYTTGQARA